MRRGTFRLSSKRRALLETLLQEEDVKSSIAPSIPRRQETNNVPLSFAQQRLWFIGLLAPDSPAYNIPTATRLLGMLDVDAFQKSLNEIVRRHEVLRTTFTTIDDQPVQVIVPSLNLTLPVIGLSGFLESERKLEVQRLVSQEARQPFDLTLGPLVRASLLCLEEDEHVLLLTMHHIVSDAWSAGVAVQELGALYEAFTKRQPSPLAELPIQYADFAVWQREWLQGEVLERQSLYWKRQLGGSLSVLKLPTDRPRPPVQSFHGAIRPLVLSKELSEALKALSRQEEVTLFMTLLAAFKTLLCRYTGQDDILVGLPIANRNQAEIEGLIGFFANTLVLRTDLSGNPTFRELLGRVREVALGAYAHQDVSFEMLVEELQPERDLSRAPLFQVMFLLQNAPMEALKLPGLTLSPLQADSGTARFDLTLGMFETAQGLKGRLEYNTDLFDTDTVDRMLGHFETLLEGAVAHPDACIFGLSLLTEIECQRTLVEWNDTQTEHPQDQCIHHLFEAWAKQMPDMVAVIFQDQHLTYGALDRRANQVAHYLQVRGVGADYLVGIYMKRSLETPIGILGTLKAGGAYVPLDPTYPEERLTYTLADIQSSVLLTKARLAERLSERGAQVICLDTDWESIAQESEANPVSGVAADNLAYAIYTSGSTGQPKGVLVSHRGLPNVVGAMVRTFDLTSTDRILQFSPLSFDASVYDILLALGSGATLCLAQDNLLPGADLSRWLRDLGVTIIPLTASALTALPDGGLATLRIVISGAEACPAELVTRWLGDSRRFFNVYGPTEATIWAAVTECLGGGQKPTIGRPISNVQMYILDSHLQLVSVGVAGEIYIGGAGVARGYLRNPAFTAEKFIPHPFSQEPGARLYKTGDLARYLPNGEIDFLGRVDHQVKVRGFRIELGEVEVVLRRYPAVREAAVVARGDKAGNKRLVAYVVPQDGQESTTSELRHFLKETLPAYMVPSAFVTLKALPLTRTGKVDRRALPAPEHVRSEFGETFVAPYTPAQKVLAEIWAKVLQIDQVGVYDNFFELGGDSILSLQVIARANQVGLKLAPRQLFEHQTIAELAAVTETIPATRAEQNIVTGTVPLTPIQHWLFEQNLPKLNHFNQALLLETRQPLNFTLLEKALQHLTWHHDALRMRFRRVAYANWQQFNAGLDGIVSLTCVNLSTLTRTDQRSAVERATSDLQASLDLEAGPLMRVALFDLGEKQLGRLFIVIHHLVVDGVSWRVLLEDLLMVYKQLARGEPVQLPSKTTSFKQWAERLVEYAQSEILEQEVNYWLAESRSKIYSLLVDHPDGVNTVISSRQVSVLLSIKETQSLLRDVHKAYRTQINDILLTALVQAFAWWTGKRSLLVALEGHGRENLFEDVDLSRTVGWFTSIFPVLLDLGRTAGPGEALKSIKEQLRHIPSHGINYGVLRYLRQGAQIAHRLQALPQPEISFNYLGQLDQTLSEPTMLSPASESSGSRRGSQGMRLYLLEINASIVEGRLQITWAYSQNFHRKSTVERLAQVFIETLRTLVAHCLSPEVGGYTPSDFPEVQLDQEELDRLVVRSKGLQRGIEAMYPLSPMQQGMLFHSLYAPTSGTYIEQLIVTLRGDIKAPTLKRAWERLVERHAILRTAFHWEEIDKPLQVVHQCVEYPWKQHDWRGFSLVEQENRLEALIQARQTQGFDFSHAPLVYLDVIQKTENVYYFFWNHHHILLDGWSTSMLFQELFAFYEAFYQGQDLHLELPRPYQDYIMWLNRQDLAKAEAFWRSTLQNFTTPTPLVMGRISESAVSREKGYGELITYLSEETTNSLQNLARRHSLTLSTIMQSVWALLLSFYSGEQEVIFGVTVSGRPADLPGVEAMVGLFINTLPMRVRIAPEMPIIEWLKKLQSQSVEARQYEYSPLVQVQSWSGVPRGLPLFESILVFENYPMSSVQKQRLALEIEDVRSIERTNYPLAVTSWPGRILPLKISYDFRRFDVATIQRMLGHLQMLLERMIADFEGTVGRLSFLTESERHQLLAEWNSTQMDHSLDGCLHELFETQVQHIPDTIAVVFEDQMLTYNEFNKRANQVARHFQLLEVGPEVRVGICMERSLEMVVGIYGILKAGGAYVPLDPTYPPERLAFMMADAQVQLLLTQARVAERLRAHMSRVICLDTDWESIAQTGDRNPISGVTPDNIAYMIYTSGSTGVPKGAMNTHRGICNRLLWMQVAYYLVETDRVMQKTPFSFDVSVWEFFWPLLNGACLVVARPEGHKDGAYLVRLIDEQQLTTLHFVPSMLQIFLEEPVLKKCRSVRQVICSGEALTYALQERFYARLDSDLHNLYGPTEAAVDVTFWDCQWESQRQIVPIGRPIANIQTYVLNWQLQPVPIGVPGELHIGGVGLGRGYHNRPELTAEKFIPHPFSKGLGARLYKTGDLARYLPDGSIGFLGRLDYQVKVRGFRVELGEIEAMLVQHPSVRESVVVAHQTERVLEGSSSSGSSRLVAYLVPEREQAPTVSELRRFLQTKLPDYMLPAAFVTLETLPLTPNGKVDRRALPEPDTARPTLDEVFVAPRTFREKELAEIWSSILGVERVGIHDNFFALGGDSILSIQVLAQARKRGLDFSLQQLFQHQTIYELVHEIKTVEPGTATKEKTEPFSLLSDKDRAKLKMVKRSNSLEKGGRQW